MGSFFRSCVILNFLLIPSIAYCQIAERELKKIPDNFNVLLYTNEIEQGLVMSFDQFKKGNFVEANDNEKSTFMTTMLLGSGTFLYDFLSQKYPDFEPTIIQPNGFTRTSFKIKYKFSDGEIFIMRIMNKKSGLDPFAAEKPSSYSLIYGIDLINDEQSNEIISALLQYLRNTGTAYTIVNEKEN